MEHSYIFRRTKGDIQYAEMKNLATGKFTSPQRFDKKR